MLRHILFLFACFVCLEAYLDVYNPIFYPGPEYPPTRGRLWPRPHLYIYHSDKYYYNLTPDTFTITVLGQTCDILKTAIDRYKNVLRNTYLIAERHSRQLKKHTIDENVAYFYKGPLRELRVNLTAPCETYPHLDMDEKYTLDILDEATLNSGSIWGVLRGLESFSQSCVISDTKENVLRVYRVKIEDFPKYSHRGLLIETSSHYLSVSTILKTLDAMEMNKMNVLHWRIVGDNSFPYQSDILPRLSEAAFDPTMIYTGADISQIVNYARDRGIRVIPEFDGPAHTRSWGVAYPSILAPCEVYGLEGHLNLGPMDPTKNQTYEVIKDLFGEVQSRFPDKYFHIGGDGRVQEGCWISDSIRQFMKDHSMVNTAQLLSLFTGKVMSLLGDRSKPIVWQDVYDSNLQVALPNGTVIQVYKGGRNLHFYLNEGYKVIYSTPWKLDNIGGGGDWFKFYNHDPRKILSEFGHKLENNILGGEACMWGNVVDDTNFISRVWPRASAVAEALWSGKNDDWHPNARKFFLAIDPEDPTTVEVRKRLEEHVCRMNRRGIHAQPANGPGFCVK